MDFAGTRREENKNQKHLLGILSGHWGGSVSAEENAKGQLEDNEVRKVLGCDHVGQVSGFYCKAIGSGEWGDLICILKGKQQFTSYQGGRRVRKNNKVSTSLLQGVSRAALIGTPLEDCSIEEERKKSCLCLFVLP